MNFNNKVIILKNKDSLKFDDFDFKCSVGTNGLTNKKKEGDKKTPHGLYNLGDIFYRKDRVNKPITNLNIKEIKPNMGWSNDVKNKDYYNKLINLNTIKKGEKLFRNDYKYNYLIPILYNVEKTIPGKGSAIFIHLTENYKSTAGCIALKENDFLILLKLINKKTKIKI